MPQLEQRDYERLLAFRTGLRRFLSWSGQQAEAAGLTPAQHQLLLAVRGHPDRRGPTVGEIAGYLLVRHHSAVELIDRAVAAGLVSRQTDSEDAARSASPSPRWDRSVSRAWPPPIWRSSTA